ncbi:hypothetical protein Bca52824_074677 [Brassica carinata]|uniref:Uncharacterized protein n=1 Tax=Brassica carinata TaxID=52824 RepID=A0A8X7PQY7_BRACI|nr:hypothetical protein Bca52824_074677 [Brassica carinata]
MQAFTVHLYSLFGDKPVPVVLGILGVLFTSMPMFGLAHCKGFTPVTLFTVSSAILTCTKLYQCNKT